MNKKILAVAISSALAVPMAAQAISFKISGHVNREILFVDDGERSDIKHVDNTASRTRFRIKGEEKLGNGWSVGVYTEHGLASNRNGLVTNTGSADADNGGDEGAGMRHSMIYFKGGFGTFNFGHTSGATDGVFHQDMSGTWMASEAAVDHGSSVSFRTSSGATAGASLASAFGVIDGGRHDVLRYDSPSFGPFSLKASWANRSRLGVSGHVSTDLAGGKFGASLGYRDDPERSASDFISGSASFLFSQGTNITVAAGNKMFDAAGRDDSTTWYVKLGHKFGAHAVSIDYAQNDDNVANGTDGERWGLGWTYSGFSKAGVDIYAGYHHHEWDNGVAGVGVDDVDTFSIGSRVKFN